MTGHRDFIAGVPEDVYYALLPLHHICTLTVCLGETVLHGAALLFARRIVTKEIIRDLREGSVTMFVGIPLLYNKILKALMKEVRAKGAAVHLRRGTPFSGYLPTVQRARGEFRPGIRTYRNRSDSHPESQARLQI